MEHHFSVRKFLVSVLLPVAQNSNWTLVLHSDLGYSIFPTL